MKLELAPRIGIAIELQLEATTTSPISGPVAVTLQVEPERLTSKRKFDLLFDTVMLVALLSMRNIMAELKAIQAITETLKIWNLVIGWDLDDLWFVILC